MRRGIMASAGVLALVVALGPVALASGASKAKTSGPEKVFVLPSSGTTSVKHPGKVLMTGTIADYGKSFSTNAKGKPTPHGGYVELELKKGTILVDTSSFDKALTKAYSHATFDKTTCSISVSGITGTVTLVSGTKAYSGITGSIMMTANLGFIGPFKNGACTTKTTTPAVATYFEITGSGTVTIP
jgi:hypothetical protein